MSSVLRLGPPCIVSTPFISNAEFSEPSPKPAFLQARFPFVRGVLLSKFPLRHSVPAISIAHLSPACLPIPPPKRIGYKDSQKKGLSSVLAKFLPKGCFCGCRMPCVCVIEFLVTESESVVVILPEESGGESDDECVDPRLLIGQ